MPPGSDQPAVAARVLAHYAGCAALLDASFAGSPIVFADFPRGFHAPPRFRHTQIPLSAARIGWLVQREYAVEFHGWAPLPVEPERLRFGRIVLHPPRRERSFRDLCEGAQMVREELDACGYDAIPVVDGTGTLTLWLPFFEAPPATKIRARLHRVCLRAVNGHPDRFCTGALPSDRCVRLDATMNGVGRYSVLPYSLRGTPALPVATPAAWEELSSLRGPILSTAETWPQRFDRRGDLFAVQANRLSSQRLRTRRAAGPAAQYAR